MRRRAVLLRYSAALHRFFAELSRFGCRRIFLRPDTRAVNFDQAPANANGQRFAFSPSSTRWQMALWRPGHAGGPNPSLIPGT